MYRGKPKRPRNGFAKRPDFILISNVYDELSKMIDNYGITKIIQHLGYIASEKISGELGSKIWYVVSKSEDIIRTGVYEK